MSKKILNLCLVFIVGWILTACNGGGGIGGSSAQGVSGQGMMMSKGAALGNAAMPVAPNLIAVGWYAAFSVDSSGNAWGWGSNASGQLGNGSTNSGNYNTPQQVALPSGVQAASISTSAWSACILSTLGNIYCWGDNSYGQDGVGIVAKSFNTPLPIVIPEGTIFNDLSVGDRSACGIDTTGSLWCWGQNYDGQLGITNNSNGISYDPGASDAARSIYYTTPQQVPSSVQFQDVAVGAFTTYALDTTGQLWSAGNNNNGQLGVSGVAIDTSAHYALQKVTQSGTVFSSVAAGTYTACALDALGRAWCWGRNSIGQLGNGTWNPTAPSHLEQAVPQLVKTTQTFTQISVGENSVCAVTPESTVYCWGNNVNGELGNGSNAFGSNIPVAVQMPANTKFVQVASGLNANCAQDTQGRNWCWGLNDSGQLGGTAASYNTPNLVGAGLSSGNSILSFSLNGTAATIVGQNINVTLPAGTDVTNLVATYTTNGQTVTVNGVVQSSGQGENNFSGPVQYVVTAANGSTKTYTVTVTVALSSANSITSFGLNGVAGSINGTNISVVMPYGTDLSGLIATYITSGAKVEVGGVIQISGQTVNNFSSLVIYTVTAANGDTKNYTVTVTVALNSAKAITSFTLDGTSATINGTNITVTLPYGTDVSALAAKFTTSGSNVDVNGITQTSGQTVNNFTNPVQYVVTAQDGSTQTYTVTVTVALNSAKAITAFSLNGTAGVINGTNISVLLPYGTNVKALIASFITTGNTVKVNGVVQVSGQTENDFTTPLQYVVTAQDGTTQTYTVTVTVALNSAKAITAFSLNGIAGVITGTNISVVMPYGTSESALVATFTTTGVSVAVNGVTQVSGQTENNFTTPLQYVVTAQDGTTQTYTVTVTVALNSAKAITAFSLNGTAGTITGESIAVTVPYGTSETALTASFTTTGNKVTVGGVTQVSGQTANNFTNPVQYVVTAQDGTTQTYIVTVTVALNGANAITAFNLNGYLGTIVAESISVTVPYGYGITNLIATFTTTGNRVAVNGVTQVSGQTTNNYTNPVTFTVTAANGNTQNYKVSVTVAACTQPSSLTYTPGGFNFSFTAQSIDIACNWVFTYAAGSSSSPANLNSFLMMSPGGSTHLWQTSAGNASIANLTFDSSGQLLATASNGAMVFTSNTIGMGAKLEFTSTGTLEILDVNNNVLCTNAACFSTTLQPPGGGYTGSCTNISYTTSGILFAKCNGNGDQANAKSNSDCENLNGDLICDGPKGNYWQTCSGIQYNLYTQVLTANCKNNQGNYVACQANGITSKNTCTNGDGMLVCQ